MPHPTPGVVEPTDVLTSAPVASAPAHGGASNDHEMATACLFVLLGVLAAVALHALRTGLGTSGPAVLRTAWQRCGPARAPPGPIFLTLCVFRL